MFRWLIEFDKKALLYINSIHSPEWDQIMWWITDNNHTNWIPFYVILLVIVIYRERPYRFIFTILFLVVTIVLCDQISVFIKNLVQRPRPTHDYELAGLVHMVNNYKGGSYGFVSSHAANAFGLITFLINQFKHYKWTFFLFTWALILSYSRIYLGVHYPLDIICGATLGLLTGIQTYILKVITVVYIERRIEDYKMNKKRKLKMKIKQNVHHS